MSFMIVAGGLALFLFALAYLRPGRFGSTVLALGVGYLLAGFWAEALAGLAEGVNIHMPFVSLRDALHAALVLLPGLLLLLFGQKRQGLVPRPVAALLVAGLAVTLLLPAFTAEPESQTIYVAAEQYQAAIISGVLVLGLLDMVFSRFPKPSKHDKH